MRVEVRTTNHETTRTPVTACTQCHKQRISKQHLHTVCTFENTRNLCDLVADMDLLHAPGLLLSSMKCRRARLHHQCQHVLSDCEAARLHSARSLNNSTATLHHSRVLARYFALSAGILDTTFAPHLRAQTRSVVPALCRFYSHGKSAPLGGRQTSSMIATKYA